MASAFAVHLVHPRLRPTSDSRKTIDQAERGHAERRALYVGSWPATFWLVGDAIACHER
jgi:hypothetical protein